MKNLIKILLLFSIFTSCKPIEKIVYVPEIHTVYKNTNSIDSIFVKDSVSIYQKNDTVYISKSNFIYKNKILIDTFIKLDTVAQIKEIVKTQKITKIQSVKLKIFNYLLILLFIYLVFTFKKPIFAFLKLLFTAIKRLL